MKSNRRINVFETLAGIVIFLFWVGLMGGIILCVKRAMAEPAAQSITPPDDVDIQGVGASIKRCQFKDGIPPATPPESSMEWKDYNAGSEDSPIRCRYLIYEDSKNRCYLDAGCES